MYIETQTGADDTSGTSEPEGKVARPAVQVDEEMEAENGIEDPDEQDRYKDPPWTPEETDEAYMKKGDDDDSDETAKPR